MSFRYNVILGHVCMSIEQRNQLILLINIEVIIMMLIVTIYIHTRTHMIHKHVMIHKTCLPPCIRCTNNFI